MDEIAIDDYDMYKKLDKGDSAYLELAPRSQYVFQFRKKYITLR